MSDAETPERYRYFLPITTRWMDNDTYGHINNVTYYSYFDTVANHYLIHEGGLDIHQGPVIGLVVESHCSYRAPLAYPDQLRAGLRVDKLGQRSVTYGIALFKEGETQAAAHGYFVHVFVGRESRRAVPIPEPLRAALERLLLS
ncbi:acyl-CoA thioesterase [Aggregicoccus sp. 17bor-14]|uniref:acyl-CoA thioesterase n=1 Tax=Myxococcaceae TaxID=31 RepID=UPI00129C215D|nr:MULTISPECIES: thioesterase family protein [Myxococcaceae]MBF5046157.1 acyl-CoA thioesterase [Simulacricoccus sp. 17bor-14]MRI91883.1 acyl-CoA thioesterase [Aggregicoccus sp. 17bor-14]